MIKKQVLKHIKLQPCFLKKRLKTKMEIYYKLNFHIKQISGPDSFIYHSVFQTSLPPEIPGTSFPMA